jgi:penicillin-binding protein 1A
MQYQTSQLPVLPHELVFDQHGNPAWPQGQPIGDNFQPPKPPSRKWFWIRRGIGGFLLLFLVILAWLAITAPLSKSLQPIAPPQLTLLAANGQPIARNGAVVDSPVKIKELPPHIAHAFMAIEDRRFYSHWGVDPRGLARAAWSNAVGSGIMQGGSTITQQLAKFTFLTPERSMTRKARELLIAFWLEARLSKDEILERYLSNVYFGDNVYGLRAASMHYFRRQPEKLTVSQAAMLAGVVQAPSRLAPTKNPKLAEKRARLVLRAMVATGYLSKAEADAMPMARADVRGKQTLPTGTYFADWAMPQARAISNESYTDLTLKTTLDANMQEAARRIISRAPLGKAQIALVAMRPNGEVVAMVGGRSYKASPFNRVTQARRQPGSTFKLFVYLAALRAGLTPQSFVDDTPITTGLYQPKNYGDKYRGKITLKQAFARSSNVAAVRLFQQLKSPAVISAARDLGINSPLAKDDPSLALGTSGTTLLELTAAYAAVAANSRPVVAHAIAQEQEGWFDWLFKPKRSLGSGQKQDLEDMMAAVIQEGTGRSARLAIPAYGKTGTSQDNRDALFIGYAGDLVVGVWIGNDDNTPLKGISGGGLPARIWADFMAAAVKGASAAPKPRAKPVPVPLPNPDGPVEPIDLPDIPEIPVNIDGTDIRINGGNEGVTVSADVGGIPIDVSLDRGGIDVRRRSEDAGDRGRRDQRNQR